MDATVHLIDRGRVRADRGYVIDGYSMASAADPDPEHEMAEFVVWNAVVDHPEATVLWDTGVPADAADRWPDPLFAAFEAYDADEHGLETDLDDAGFAVGDVDAVVTSHLHLDHAGGLHHFEGTDVPVYVHEEELKYAYYSARTTEGSIAYLAEDFHRDLAWEVVHRDRRQLLDGVELLHLPGHTPGVLGARIDSGGETLLVSGDETYVQENWTEEVPLGPGLLWSERAWRESLHRLKDLQRRTDADVLHGHDLERFEALPRRWP